MERLKMMKETLMSCVQSQMGDLKNADAEELGEAVDMIKDLSEAIYYCTITKAMEEQEKDEKTPRYYSTYYHMMPQRYEDEMYEPYRDMDRHKGKMYYTASGRSSSGSSESGRGDSGRGGRGYYSEPYEDGQDEMYPMHIHDFREGRSALSRKSYIESKELHKDKNIHMKELEKYLRELTQDITEMIQDASPEEKSMLHQKIATLAEKI